MKIRENILIARENIARAAESVGRDAREIRLLAATKMNDADLVREAVAAGVDLCGENRVQELVAKNAENAYAPCPVHFIGHLQRNKVKYLVGTAALIHSVDSVALMQEIDRCAEKRGLRQDILLEVNIGGEAAKSGVAPEELDALLCAAGDYPHLRVCGLMTIPPAASSKEKNCFYFEKMHQLFVDISEKKYDNVIMTELSMGMSHDYTDAVRAGATIVRLGTAIFGPRHYNINT